MKRIERILKHPVFIRELHKINTLEQDRRYCRHSIVHLLDVARIAYILNLEQHLNLPKDIIYATALLHDIGKGIQYEDGTPHNISSAELAGPILKDCGYTPEEIPDMITAIRLHRKKSDSDNALVQILYTADKQSRACFSCQAQEDCNWSQEKKNLILNY